ncbi:MAG: lipoyl synthase, partial [Gammaproteobacteria bacterium]|nr:lipoyl synthase [Gammaproteobacteria bacterium]
MSITIHPHKKAEIKMNALKRRKEKYWPERTVLEKPQWLRKVAPSADRVEKLVKLFADKELHTVCQEASCPNLVECFDQKIATFMILGSICTRRCSFCDVAHGIPLPVDRDEPARLARTVMEMGLKYVVITSVDRDDLPDGGAQHFVNCIKEILACNSDIKIECLVPDFKKKQPIALECFRQI